MGAVTIAIDIANGLEKLYNCSYIYVMSELLFSWDDKKNIANQRKHGISFELAANVFFDPFHLSIQDRFEGGEQRWQTLGTVGGVVVLLVAHTVNDLDDGQEKIRIISARKATRLERKNYERI